MDEYDRTLEEDSKTNRLTESLQLFGDVTGSQWFQATPFILFLNKSDLFRDKIAKKPLHEHFPDVPVDKGADFEYGAHVLSVASSVTCVGVQYIQDKYEDAFRGHRLYPYVTCAIDTETCQRIFHTVQDTIITQLVTQVGL